MKYLMSFTFVVFSLGCGLLDPLTGGTGGGAAAGTTGGTGGGSGGSATVGNWTKISPPDEYVDSSTYVYGVHCTAADKCIIATNAGRRSMAGAVFALTSTGWGERLVDGTYGSSQASMLSGVLGDLNFIGFVPTRTGLVARVTTSSIIVSASGDPTSKANWSVVKTGTAGGEEFGLNATLTIQSASDNDWVFANNNGYVYSASQPPSASTSWTRLWSPNARPSVPLDFEAQYTADKTLCDWDISTTSQPFPAQGFWAAPDLSLIIHPAYGLNQNSWREINNRESVFGPVKPGVCISTDKGRHFHFAPINENLDVSNPGPYGVTCLTPNKCFAFNGTSFQQNSYIYYSENALMGSASTWTKATVPSFFATSNEVGLTAIFFAPDGVHGWAVGNLARKPLMLRTTDGGKSWTDVSGQVNSLAQSDLQSGFALDENKVWVVGRYGFVGMTTSAQK